MSLANLIQESFFDKVFTLQEVYQAIPDKPQTTIRGRIYDNLGIKFEKISRGLFRTIKGKNQCIVIEGDGRDLSILEDNSITAIITDHAWDSKANKGGNRNFASEYNTFTYELSDFKEKARVLKDGCFLVEILPAENESNFEYLYEIKKMAQECGLNYYACVDWKKGSFVSNTGRKSKNTESVMFFSKGKARNLRIDVKKTKATGEVHYMSGTNGMLPTCFDVEPVPKNRKIHQSEKPVALFEQIIGYITKDGENGVILDQGAGSGAVGEAALNKNFNCILIEILKENVKKIVNRLSAVRYCSQI